MSPVILLALLFLGGGATDKLVLSIYQDSRGHLLQTWELRIFETGRVEEERYDFTGPPALVHTVRNLRKLKPEELKAIRRVLSDNGFDTLPSAVEAEEGIVPDAPFRILRVTSHGHQKDVEWNNFRRPLRTHTGVLFDGIWQSVLGIVRYVPPN
jgi:hypothetical protein